MSVVKPHNINSSENIESENIKASIQEAAKNSRKQLGEETIVARSTWDEARNLRGNIETAQKKLLDELIALINRIPDKTKQERQNILDKLKNKDISTISASLKSLESRFEWKLLLKPVVDGVSFVSNTRDLDSQVWPEKMPMKDTWTKKVRVIPLEGTPSPSVEQWDKGDSVQKKPHIYPQEPVDISQWQATWEPLLPTLDPRKIPKPIDPEQNPTTEIPAIPTPRKRDSLSISWQAVDAVESRIKEGWVKPQKGAKKTWEQEVTTIETSQDIQTPEQAEQIQYYPIYLEHKVQAWQSLWKIVEKYFPSLNTSAAINAKIDQIVRDNNIEKRDELLKWQKLKISWANVSLQQWESSEQPPKHYRVAKGDNLWKIVERYFPHLDSSDAINTQIDVIVRENNIKDKNSILIGQLIKLPTDT